MYVKIGIFVCISIGVFQLRLFAKFCYYEFWILYFWSIVILKKNNENNPFRMIDGIDVYVSKGFGPFKTKYS